MKSPTSVSRCSATRVNDKDCRTRCQVCSNVNWKLQTRQKLRGVVLYALWGVVMR